MPNKTYALEWYELARRNLETASVLIREKHYTDSIAIEIQQTIEKAFKAIYAFHGVQIPKTHSLPLLFSFVQEKTALPKNFIDDLIVISDYYESDRYPGPKYFIPSSEEVETYFLFAEDILKSILIHLNCE